MGRSKAVALTVLGARVVSTSAYHNRAVVLKKDASFSSPTVREQKVVSADCVFSNIDVYLMTAARS